MVFFLSETVTLRNICESREYILNKILNYNHVNIDIEKCTDIDLSGLQLIEAARIHAAASGKAISLSNPANPAVEAVLARAGFTERMSPEDRHFWFHKEG